MTGPLARCIDWVQDVRSRRERGDHRLDPLIRSELFSVARLERHAESLATAQRVLPGSRRDHFLVRRLRDNRRCLLAAHAEIAAAVQDQRSITPAAEWLLGNFHVVEAHVAEVLAAMPAPHYRRLPQLAGGVLAGRPRVFGIAWAVIAHSDSLLATDSLTRFVRAYQRVQPLTIGELWAIPTMLQLVLAENLRRAAQGISHRSAERAAADSFAEALLARPPNHPQPQPPATIPRLSPAFAAQVVMRLRDHDPLVTPAFAWLDARLAAQGSDADQVVTEELRRQGADDATVRNAIVSMRLLGAVDWAEFFSGVSLVDAALAAGSAFAAMDLPSRDRYRHAVEDLAHGSGRTELEIVAHAMEAGAEPARGTVDEAARRRHADPGHHLLGSGRRRFERRVGYSVPLHDRLRRLRIAAGLPGYLATVAVLAAGFLAVLAALLASAGTSPLAIVLLTIGAAVLATDVAVAIVHHGITRQLGPVTLPGLELRQGVPAELRTLIAVPTMLSNLAAIAEHVERLEVHFLASPGDDLVLALLSDWTDADSATRPGDDALLAAARTGIALLNQRHGPGPAGERFLLLHRRRVWNASEDQWIGWERKRGKLHELDRWLRGATDTTFLFGDAAPTAVPPGIRYVITLDADTRLPRGAARQLVGKMAHPLQQPSIDPETGCVTEGHAVLQPRITPSLPDVHESSWYQRLFSGPSGFDGYGGAVSDVYQDLLGEGSYAGKGIYALDAFESALAGRVPDNTVLSHDLLEGVFARAGLASDVELFEDAPARYDIAAARQHRWARGDWQLLPWVLGRGRDRSGHAARAAIPFAGRWKMLDNLRRTLVAPMAASVLAGSWCCGVAAAATVTAFVTATLVVPLVLPLGSLLTRRRGPRLPMHSAMSDIGIAAARAVLALTFLAHHALLMVHAIATTLARLFVRRQRMLEWLTSADAGVVRSPDTLGFYRRMAPSVVLAGGALLALVVVTPRAWPVALPVLALWSTAPLLAQWLSRNRAADPGRGLGAADVRSLRARARRTWSFFTTFVGEQDHWLPPDNFQESPTAMVAHRTSPTNVGLYLLSVVAARDFGWLSTADATARLEATLDTLERLEHCRGHLLNWYDTRDLRPLEPKYVSTVDSGNLAGHLIAIGEACREWVDQPVLPRAWREGIADAVQLAREALQPQPNEPHPHDVTHAQLGTTLATMHSLLQGRGDTPLRVTADLAQLAELAGAASELAQTVVAAHPGERATIVAAWTAAARSCIDSHRQALATLLPCAADRTGAQGDDASTSTLHARMPTLADLPALGEMAQRRQAITERRGADRSPRSEVLLRAAADAKALANRLETLHARLARRVAAMQFSFLFDPGRRLLAIGYRVAEDALDHGHYDLLASEARLASFVAIAKGDLPATHWFRLGRGATKVPGGAVLVSWSGSLFEYLMPTLVMREPLGSLLAQTARLVVRRQIAHGAELGVPWGVSECAYNVRDLELTYQYSSFGVPGLGQKRGLEADTVVAPYATALASMVDPRAACANYAHLAAAGAEGRHGNYEALDYTPTRRPPGSSVAVIQTYMAHHQGMTIVAIGNTLHGGVMRSRFHRAPAVKATELLLQERVPRGLPVAPTAVRQLLPAALAHPAAPAPMRRFHGPHDASPRTHLLSNGHYAVMLAAAGGGWSRWLDTAVTRWREDVTCDAWGSWFYLRDPTTGAFWSAGYQPTAVEPDSYEVAFAEGRAEFTRQDGDITTRLEVVVSPEHDAEVRRLSITNLGFTARDIDLTSYCEVVLTSADADAAHPTFARMFLQTDHVAHLEALTATRRRRSPEEPEAWAAHLAVVEGTVIGKRQFETDRARFLGRGGTTRAPQAVRDGRALTNTVGTVLDPIFSLRVRLRIQPGQTSSVAFWTMVASSRAAVLGLADKHRDAAAFARATTMAWTQSQVQLQHLGIGAEEALLFQRLANRVVYSDASLRPPDAVLQHGSHGPSSLWAQGISGDLPIVLVRVLDEDDLPLVRQLLRAQQYWRGKRLAVDLVIINDHVNSYRQDLHIALDALARTMQARGANTPGSTGRVFVLRRDLVAPATRSTLQAVARAVLYGRRGSLAEQVRRRPETAPSTRRSHWPMPDTARSLPPPAGSGHDSTDSEFWNGLGGFTRGGCEYTIRLRPGESTPAPWINVVANPDFGFQVSAEGSGYTWSGNSRENQLTPWSNDPTTDPAGEAFYLRDVATGAIWCPTASPLRAANATFTATHGRGYTRFEHTDHDVSVELLQFVPLVGRVKVSRLRIHNRAARSRLLSVTAYVEWVLGSRRDRTAHHVVTEVDRDTSVLLARNPWREHSAQAVAFLDLGGRQTRWTSDRGEFLGRNGTVARPRGMVERRPWSQRCGAGFDPCAVLEADVELPPHGSLDVVCTLGEAEDRATAVALARRYRGMDLDGELRRVTEHWDELLGTVQVRTPDRAFDLMLNHWLLYQTVACRLWARSAFYQASGAYGFRDQLQDTMALVLTRPDLARAHLLRAAAQQFDAGDVQHWWLPHSGQGVRTRISDDALWLAYATAHYVATTADAAILDAPVPFLRGPPLGAGELEAFRPTQASDEVGTLFEHCARALDRSLPVGAHGLPRIGTGDWNDGMNRVGVDGAGESVWLAWFLHADLLAFAPLAEARGEPARARAWRQHADRLVAAIETEAWDGAWYRRGYFDDGSPLGADGTAACRIDSIAQSWAVLSGAASPQRAARAMASLYEHLVRRADGLVLLFTPPFEEGDVDPGYVRGYPPGLRENGGQYTHAAAWVVMAFARLGDGDRAAEIFGFLNPIRRAATRIDVHRYKVEPYVTAGDVYSVAPLVGRGGWTWYTGSAAWLYRAGLESMLGLVVTGDSMIVDPCIPKSWREFVISYRRGTTRYRILVENPMRLSRGVVSLELDGVALSSSPPVVPLVADGSAHEVRVVLG